MGTKSRLFILIIILLTAGCTRSAHTAPYINFSEINSASPQTPTSAPYRVPTRDPGQPILTPTPNLPQPLPTLRTEEITHVVSRGETVKAIAQRYRVLPAQISQANNLTNPNLIHIGQRLIIPAPQVSPTGPDFKIIPDSELVYGPYTVQFQIANYLEEQGGYLHSYQEEVDQRDYSGAELIQRIAMEYSVNPRILIALVEFQSGWVTQNEGKNQDYPLKFREAGYEGLYKQLAWAANELNRGYYLWRIRGVGAWLTREGMNVPINPTLNAGTAGIQGVLSQLYPYTSWLTAVTEDGFFTTYTDLFGYPFDYSFTPLVPADLSQPPLQLPFEKDVVWAFTGGPHGGWDSGSAWAALDFAPPPGNQGCVLSKHWVVAAAAGEIVYADQGAVIQSIDGDSNAQTGWSLVYMHIDSHQQVETGTYLEAGERIGHPSCEGGFSTGTHLHLARRYNGEWIPADQNLPFDLQGWISQGTGAPYQGTLVNGEQVIPAEDHRTDYNLIHR